MFKMCNIFKPLAGVFVLLALSGGGSALAAEEVPLSGPSSSWDDGEGSVFTTPQLFRSFSGEASAEPIKPLPRAAQAGSGEALELECSLRIVSEPQESSKPKADPSAEEQGTAGAVFSDAFGPLIVQPSLNDGELRAAAELPLRFPAWLKESPLWLFVRIKPNIENSYFYAPFALGQSARDREAMAGAVLPTELEIVDENGEPVPGVRFYYPGGRLKADYFSGLSLPVYQEEILVAAAIPGSLLGTPARLNINALICTESSCTPFRKTYDLSLNTGGISSEPLDGATAALLGGYQSAPFGGEPAPAPRAEARTAPPPGALDNAIDQARLEGRLSDYLRGITPRYHVESLEVENIWMAVLLGLVAGFILNFMPCVLPVISLKLGTLVGLGGWNSLEKNSPAALQNRRRFRLYGLCFSLGVFVWFGMLFGVIGFAGLIWGQFFQIRELILGLAMLIFVLALSMFGLVRIPLLHIKIDGKRSLALQAFLGGLLATLLATPCSGPLLGGVLGWAVNQSLPFLGVTLMSVAAGMASPFILMALRPGLARFLPKPGPWTITLERVMGFVLMATVIYLLSMLEQAKIFVVLSALLALAFSAWLWSRPVPEGKNRFTLCRVMALVLLVPALYFPFAEHQTDTSWKPFNAAEFQRDLGQRNLLLDFTADWCINCRVMEATTLTEQRLARWARAYNLTYVKVDLTGKNPDGEALLNAMGSASIPLLAIIPADKPSSPTVLRDLVTPGQLDKALQQAFK